MPATADAKTPVATTSRIIPLIMIELLIFALPFASRAAWHELGKGGYCAADTAAEKKRAHEAPLRSW
jgi:hypothetical protein